MSRYLDPFRELPDDETEWLKDDDQPAGQRPAWWRWVALVLVIALVVATPFVYALSRLFR